MLAYQRDSDDVCNKQNNNKTKKRVCQYVSMSTTTQTKLKEEKRKKTWQVVAYFWQESTSVKFEEARRGIVEEIEEEV